MYLTGYHGTKKELADSIINSKSFLLSKGDEQWLGDGIYFYPDFGDAFNWKYDEKEAAVESVIHVIVKINDDEYLDLDDDDAKRMFSSLLDELAKSADVKPTGIQKNQNAVCKAIWEKTPKLRLMMASFPREKTKYPAMIDTREKRKEFCVRDNSCIVYMNKIERGEIHD